MSKQEIEFTCYLTEFPEGFHQVFLFYPMGIRDESVLFLKEALVKYPLAEYKWVFVDEGA